MNNSRDTLTDKLKIDREIEEMKKHPIDIITGRLYPPRLTAELL